MKALLLIAAWLAAIGATLGMSVTAPDLDNAGSCTIPVLQQMIVSTGLKIHFAWLGPVAGEDSVSATPGHAVSMFRTVPAGTYSVRGWATKFNAKPGCDTTISVNVFDITPPPGPVRFINR